MKSENLFTAFTAASTAAAVADQTQTGEIDYESTLLKALRQGATSCDQILRCRIDMFVEVAIPG